VAEKHIRTHSELAHVEFIPLNDVNAFNLGNPLDGIADEGSVFIQSPETDPQRVWDHIPAYGQKLIRNKRLKVFYLDTVKIAKEIATEADLQQRMQGVCLVGIFIKVTPFASRSGMSDEQVLGAVEKYIRKYFGKRGETVVQENLKCVREGLKSVMEIPWSIISAPAAPKAKASEEVVFAK
ncbi:MAG TPA: 2-oxoacid:acceptor oxidoreductase family protein, partial [Verrucomicrobiota bacterium]|nr:2-oxoacid:acceptor oxidoreductase family protein [Verrucomicrobiota bacterium]